MTTPRLVQVVATARNGVIGAEGDMPWRQPTDMARFKSLTLGKPVLMGRKTFAAIGRPLPKRTNIVVSRSDWSSPEGVHLTRDLDAGIALALAIARRDGVEHACVIGGAQIYAQTLARVERVYLTRIEADLDGDAHFPPLGPEWREMATESVPAGPRDDHAMTFLTYERHEDA